MCSSLANPSKPCPPICIALLAALTLLSSGWTCTAMFVSCQGLGTQPQITSLSPDTVPRDAESVLLIVEGSGFSPQSQIMWNGSALPTTFTDSRHVETTITQQTFDSFGGSAGSSVQISMGSKGSGTGCPPPNGNSAALLLVIN
jgi:IPT/TIG domain